MVGVTSEIPRSYLEDTSKIYAKNNELSIGKHQNQSAVSEGLLIPVSPIYSQSS